MKDWTGNGQMYEIYDLNTNAKRCLIKREDLIEAMKLSKVQKLDVGHMKTVRLSESVLINKAMQYY